MAAFQEMTIAQPQMSLDECLQSSIETAPEYNMLASLLQAPFQDSYVHDSQAFDMLAPESLYDMSFSQSTSNLEDPLLQVDTL